MMRLAIELRRYTLEREAELLRRRARDGLPAAGAAVQAAARANLAEHRFRGTAEEATTVSPVRSEGDEDVVTVGVHDLGLAPHARALEFGWRSRTGRQPPSAPIAAWGLERGIVDEREAPGFGFVVARRIGRTGFSFGALHFLGRAAEEATPAVAGAIESAAREG